jgi:hypothetical protein
LLKDPKRRNKISLLPEEQQVRQALQVELALLLLVKKK